MSGTRNSIELTNAFGETYPSGSFPRYMGVERNEADIYEARFVIVDPESIDRGTSLFFNHAQLTERRSELQNSLDRNPDSKWLQGYLAQFEDAIWDLENSRHAGVNPVNPEANPVRAPNTGAAP